MAHSIPIISETSMDFTKSSFCCDFVRCSLLLSCNSTSLSDERKLGAGIADHRPWVAAVAGHDVKLEIDVFELSDNLLFPGVNSAVQASVARRHYGPNVKNLVISPQNEHGLNFRNRLA